MKIFFSGWDNVNDDLYGVALGLAKSGHEIVYWVGVDVAKFEIDKQREKELFKNTQFHYYRDAVFGIPAAGYKETDFFPAGEDLIENFYETESVFLSMLRNHFECWSVMKKKNIYYQYLQYWYGVLQCLKPDVIIFQLWPHGGYDYVIYSLAKYLDIKTIMFEYTRIGDRMVLINDFKIGSTDLKNEIAINHDKKIITSDLSLYLQLYYKQQLDNTVDSKPEDMKTVDKKFSRFSLLKSRILFALRSIIDLSIFEKMYIYFSKIIGPNLKKEYKKFEVNPDFSKKFLYVALHTQPECSSSPLGGVFIDQLLMIKILSASVPKDWLIYVKEHPYQWLSRGIAFSAFRYEGYYKTIASLSNVRLVPLTVNTFDLINKSKAVATITGTNGWEAVLRSKPALVFGHCWYRQSPGVFKVNNVETCKKALKEIESGYKIITQDMINYLYSFDKISIRGYFEDWKKYQVGLEPVDYKQSMLNALLKEINK